jgi:voltage-gated potassium channel
VDTERRARAFETLERATEVPMLILALTMVPLLLAPMLFDISEEGLAAIRIGNAFVWLAFTLELTSKTYLAPDRLLYLRRHWFDVVIVVLPFLRLARVIRAARVLRLFRVVRVAAFLAHARETTDSLLDRHGLKYVLLLTTGVLVAAAGLVALLERGTGSGVQDFEQALWWVLATIMTAGFSDEVPSTTASRVVAVLLTIVGLAVFSIVTANIAAHFIRSEERKESSLVMQELKKLEDQLAEIRLGAEMTLQNEAAKQSTPLAAQTRDS